MRIRPRPPFLMLLAFVVILLPGGAQGQDSIPSRLEKVGTLRSKRLTESSGVAMSRAHPGILWTHNDSGDKPVVYAINRAGEVLGAFSVTGARASDWEDMAMAPCPDSPSPCLYIADTGDNRENRKTVSIYVVPEPDPALRGDTARTVPAREIRVRYPDSPHDVEAITVDSNRRISLFTKGWTRSIVQYEVDPKEFARDTARARLVDTLPITPVRTLGRLVTGAALSPSGKRAVLRTYSELYFFTRSNEGRLKTDGRPCWLGAVEPQGEAIDFVDEETVIMTSESIPNQDGSIHEVRCGRGQGPRASES